MLKEMYSTEDKDRGKRIKELREQMGLKQEELADMISMGRTSVVNYEAGGGLKFPIAQKLADIFKVSTDYIFNGEPDEKQKNGNDYDNVREIEHIKFVKDYDVKNTESLNSNLLRNNTLHNFSHIPFYDFEASAGDVMMFKDTQELTDTYLVIPGMHDCDISLSIWGDSMYPYYTSGDVIICKRVIDKEVISYGDTYLVITQELRLVKYIHPHPTDEHKIILRSANDQYPDIPLHRDKILNLFLVKGKLQRKNI